MGGGNRNVGMGAGMGSGGAAGGAHTAQPGPAGSRHGGRPEGGQLPGDGGARHGGGKGLRLRGERGQPRHGPSGDAPAGSPCPVSRHPCPGTIPVPRHRPLRPRIPEPTRRTRCPLPGWLRGSASAPGYHPEELIPHRRKMPAAEGRRLCPSTGRLRPGPAHGARRGEHPLITSSLLLFYPLRSAEPKARRCTGQEKAPSEGRLRFPIKAL